MRVFCPESWPQIQGIDYSSDISLAAILPRAGQQPHAFFFSDDVPAGQVTHLLWKPPYTAINGWGERPAEIARSFLLTVRAGHPSKTGNHQYRYDLDVIDCEPLLPKLKALAGDWALQECLDLSMAPPRKYLIWEQVFWCGIGEVDGLTYISASASCETQMELLIEEVDGELFGLLYTHSSPGGDYCHLGRRKFSERERSVIDASMKQAVPLVDSYGDYLRD